MSEQVLTQRSEELPRTQVLVVETTIENLSLSNTGKESRGPKGRLDFDVDLSERGRKGDVLRVGYRLSFGRSAVGKVCRISGEAAVHFANLGPEAGLQNLGGEATNDMAVAIFRKNFEAIYLLHDALGVEAPSPWITEDVSLSSHQ